jgi:hypothetical protein
MKRARVLFIQPRSTASTQAAAPAPMTGAAAFDDLVKAHYAGMVDLDDLARASEAWICQKPLPANLQCHVTPSPIPSKQ